MPSSLPLPKFDLDPKSSQPLFRQVHHALRAAMLAGALQPGMRLPPSRTLAEALGVSRQTVVIAYEHLIADGYLAAHVGRGTFVTSQLPLAAPARASDRHAMPPHRVPSERGLGFLAPVAHASLGKRMARAFCTGMPALEIFPQATWARLEGRHSRRRPQSLGYDEVAGSLPLRESLAHHLRTTRGMNCEAGQVMITTGTQQALHLIATLLLDPGDPVWMENPGYRWAAAALRAAGAVLQPVAVDEEGLRVADGIARCPLARLAYVTPSHQCPLGATMSLRRRLELLAWARQERAWIVEDDYDSEYRYDSPVPAALQSMDRDGSVLHVGTLSKLLFPGLRLGYLVLPPALVDIFCNGKALLDRHTAQMPQRVLADFIEEGHFQRHIRRTRALYDERRQALLQAMQTQLPGLLHPGPFNAGMQIAASFQGAIDDMDFARRAAQRGLDVLPLSAFYAEGTENPPLKASGLLLGFACITPAAIRKGVAVLRETLEE